MTATDDKWAGADDAPQILFTDTGHNCQTISFVCCLRAEEDIGKWMESVGVDQSWKFAEKLTEVSTDIARVDVSFPDVLEWCELNTLDEIFLTEINVIKIVCLKLKYK